MPVLTAVARIIDNELTPKKAVLELMRLPQVIEILQSVQLPVLWLLFNLSYLVGSCFYGFLNAMAFLCRSKKCETVDLVRKSSEIGHSFKEQFCPRVSLIYFLFIRKMILKIRDYRCCKKTEKWFFNTWTNTTFVFSFTVPYGHALRSYIWCWSMRKGTRNMYFFFQC